MTDIVATVITPSQLSGGGELGHFDLERFDRAYLAQGDSWFSIGHIPPWCTSNLLAQMVLTRSSCIVNCARPGEVLAHMTDTTTQRRFLQLLRGKLAYRWHAVLLSGGGNDLIDAVAAPPAAAPQHRLLRVQQEWGAAGAGAARYVSEPGWSTFEVHLHAVFDSLLVECDKGPNADVPVLCHSYDHLTPRDAPAGLGFGPWLYTALKAYAIPETDWHALSRLLLERHREILRGVAARHAAGRIIVVDTLGTLTPAASGDADASNDWENEIHPRSIGYASLARRWRPVLDAL